MDTAIFVVLVFRTLTTRTHQFEVRENGNYEQFRMRYNAAFIPTGEYGVSHFTTGELRSNDFTTGEHRL